MQDQPCLSCLYSQTTEALSTPVRGLPTPGRLPGRFPKPAPCPCPSPPVSPQPPPGSSLSMGNVSLPEGGHLPLPCVHQVLEESRGQARSCLAAMFPGSDHRLDSCFICDHLLLTTHCSVLLLLSHVHAC